MSAENLVEYLDEIEKLLVEQGNAEAALDRLMSVFAQARGNVRVAWLAGQALYALERYDEAEKFFNYIIYNSGGSSFPEVFRALLAMYCAQKKHQSTINCFNQFSDRIGDDVGCLFLVVTSFFNLERYSDAIIIYEKIIFILSEIGGRLSDELLGTLIVSLHNYSFCLLSLQRGEDSVSAFGRKTDFIEFKRNRQSSSSAQGKRTDYNSFSETYEENIGHQWIPSRLVTEYNSACEARQVGLVLELGCGTGLLSKFLSNYTQLVGIDLSQGMLAKAKMRGKYNNLFEGDVVDVMSRLSYKFDTIFSSGVLYHVEDLKPVFLNVTRLLNPGGIFAFSTDPDIDDHEVRSTGPGEYAHSRRYLRRLAAETGLIERRITIDLHRGTPGFWCVFEKPMD